MPVEQQDNKETLMMYVCVFYDHMNTHMCGDFSESMTEVTKSNFTLVCVHQRNVRNNADNFIPFSLFISHTLSLVKVILSKHQIHIHIHVNSSLCCVLPHVELIPPHEVCTQ